MLDITKLPESLLDALTKRGHTKERIGNMHPTTAFNEACTWNGLINWGPVLWEWVRALQAAEVDELPAPPLRHQIFRDPREEVETWRVRFEGRLQRPLFPSARDALSFLQGLGNGTRQEEPQA